MTSSKILALCTLSILALAPGLAHAQRSAADIESARQLYNQGVELKDKGDLKGALEKLRAAHALGNTPITGLELCRVHAALNQPVEAREVCLGVGRIPPTQAETQRSKDARVEAAKVAEEVRPKMGGLRLVIRGVPPGREPTVTVDGNAVPAAALGEPRAVDPGPHEVMAKVGRGPESRARVEVKEGETKDLDLSVQALADEPPPVVVGPAGPYQQPQEPPPQQKKRSNALATVGFVVAGVGVGIGSIAGIVAMAKKSDLDGTCANKICGQSDHDALDQAKTWGNVSTGMFIVGGVGLALGVYAVVTAKPSSSGAIAPAKGVSVVPDFGPQGVGVHGAF